MTVPTNDNREQYQGNGATTVFPYAFRIFEDADLEVYLTQADGTQTLLTLGTDYAVTGAGDEDGGSITYPVSGDPLDDGETLTILRVIALTQETDLRNQGAYYPEVVEDELDRSRMIDQQLQEQVDRSMTQDVAEVAWQAQGKRITDIGDPEQISDAVTKGYIDERFQNDVITKTAGQWDGQGAVASNFSNNEDPSSDELVTTSWVQMYVATIIGGGGVVPDTYLFSGDGTTTTFPINGIDIGTDEFYVVTVNGLDLRPTDDYVVDLASQEITFTNAPPEPLIEDDNNVMVRVMGFKRSISEGDMTLVTAEGSLVTRTMAEWVEYITAAFDTVADMVAASWLKSGIKCRTLGYYSKHDGGANDYTIVPGGTGTVDGGLFIALDSGLQARGVFLTAALDPRQFGATTATSDIKPYLDRLEAASSLTGLRININQIYKMSTSKQVNRELDFGNNGAIEVTAGTSLLLPGQRSLNMNDYLPPSGYFSDQAAQMRGPIRRLFINEGGRPILDLGGRVITIDSPLDFAEITGLTQYGFPARIQNGIINLGPDFTESTSVVTGVTATNGSRFITVADTSNIKVGDKVTNSNAFVLETFVQRIDSSTEILLNKEAIGDIANGTSRFRRLPFAFDLSSMGTTNRLSFLTFDNVEFRCNGYGSAVRLPEYFQGVWFRNCMINDPSYYGVLKTNNGNSLDFQVFGCHFYSTGFNDDPADRTAVAISYQGGDAHIIGNVLAYYKHSIILGSGGYIIANNHPYQGNEADDSAPLEPCIIFTKSGGTAAITGNYIDNSYIRLSNQDDSGDTTPLGRMTITGNRWVQKATAPDFAFIELEIWRDTAKALHDLTVTGNWFLSLAGVVDCTKVTTKFGGALSYTDIQDLHFNNNTFKNVNKVSNPAVVESVVTAQTNDLVDFAGKFPFSLRVGRIDAVVPRVDTAQAFRVSQINQPANTAQVTYAGAVTGSTIVTGRCDFQP